MTERQYLLVGTIANAVLGTIGVAFSFFASSQVILLDGLFNVTYFVSGLFTLKVAQLLLRGDDEDFPFGYASFEPLVNGIKGVLVLGVTLMAVVGAVGALLQGGSSVAAGPAIAYAVIATISCLAVAFVSARGAKRTQSPLIKADAENWMLNGVLSAVVLAAFIVVLLLEGSAYAYVIPYVDPVMVLATVALCISIPVRQAWQAVLALLNRGPPADVVAAVRATVEACTASLPVQVLYLRIVQTGRSRLILAHVVLPKGHVIGRVDELDDIRHRTHRDLAQQHPNSAVEMVFTADRELSAFANDGLVGAPEDGSRT